MVVTVVVVTVVVVTLVVVTVVVVVVVVAVVAVAVVVVVVSLGSCVEGEGEGGYDAVELGDKVTNGGRRHCVDKVCW